MGRSHRVGFGRKRLCVGGLYVEISGSGGACCDIDVETGPRQMPSRYLRRRLELLLSVFPPPEGYAVLPEQLKAR
jgi:hypothetical protein